MAQYLPQQQKNPSKVSNLLQTMSIDEQNTVNVLLLGPSKAGKSTFVNALANYLTYRSLDDAEKEKLVVVNSSSFTIIDKDSEEHMVTVNSDCGEDEFENDSASIQTFVLPVNNGNTNLQLICTPGLCGSLDGDEDDRLICEDILSYIAQLDTIHAVCCILPVNTTTNSELETFFDYCFNKILAGFHQQIYENLLLIFTHSQATYYKAGSSLSAFKKFLSSIENSSAKKQLIHGNNTFYFENNSFRYLAARQNNIEFDLDIKEHYNSTWVQSDRESHRFIDYMIEGNGEKRSRNPYVMNTYISVLPVRWNIIKFLQPIFDVLDFIKNNLTVLEERLQFFSKYEWSSEAVKMRLNIPGFNLKVSALPQPVTMCANSNSNRCAICYTMDSIQIWQLQRCCESCHLNSPPRCLVGDLALLDCEKMQASDGEDAASSSCSHCGCSTHHHVHAYYLTRMEKTSVDCGGASGSLHQQVEHVQKEIEVRITEYRSEMKIIVESAAEFVHFLQSEAIAPYDDPYVDFLQYLMSREQTSRNDAGEKNIEQMEIFLQHYKDMKETLAKASNLRKRLGNEICLPLGRVTPEEIMKSIDVLYGLKHTGSKIRELIESQRTARTKEFNETIIKVNLNCCKDVKYNEVSRQPRDNRNWNKDCRDGSIHKNQRGRGYQWRNKRGKRGAYQGNHHQSSNMPPVNNDERSAQPPPYSQLYPDQHEPNRNSNIPQQGTHRPDVPYVQINVLTDLPSAAGDSQPINMNYKHRGNQQRGGGGFSNQNRGGGNSYRGNSYQNRGARGQQNRGGDNRNWHNSNRGNQQGPNQNRRQNANTNQNQFQHGNTSDSNHQRNQYSNQMQSRGNQQQRAGFDQHTNAGLNQQKTGLNQQKTGLNQQQANVNSNQRISSGQRGVASSGHMSDLNINRAIPTNQKAIQAQFSSRSIGDVQPYNSTNQKAIQAQFSSRSIGDVQPYNSTNQKAIQAQFSSRSIGDVQPYNSTNQSNVSAPQAVEALHYRGRQVASHKRQSDKKECLVM